MRKKIEEIKKLEHPPRVIKNLYSKEEIDRRRRLCHQANHLTLLVGTLHGLLFFRNQYS